MVLFGGGSQKVKTKVDYPSWWGQLFNPTIADFQNVYQQQHAQGGLHPLQQAGLGQQAALAQQGTAGSAPNALEGILQGGGVAPGVGGFAQNLMGGGMVNPAMAETQRIAMGGDVGSNPFLDAAFGRAAGNVTGAFKDFMVPGMDRAAAQQGALGSGAYAQMRNRAEDQVGQSLTDLATGMFGGAFEGERNRQMGALGQFAGLGQQDVANRMAGAGLLDQGVGRQLQGIGLGPTVQQMRYTDPQMMAGAGGAMQSAQWQPGQQMLNALYGIPGIGGSQVQQSPGMNPLVGMLQGGMGGAQSGAMIGALGGFPMGPAMGVGGGLGALAGMLSDRRAKKDIKKVAETDDGLGVYRFRYRAGGPAQLGFMAQEVRAKKPEAVVTGADGLHRVLYELAA